MFSRLSCVVILSLLTTVGHSQTPGQTVEQSVDWKRGIVSTTIQRPIPSDAVNKPSAISRIQSQIEHDAVGIIAAGLMSLTYDSYYTIDELLGADESQIQKVLSAAALARAVDAKSSPDLQSALVTFELDIAMDILARFVLHQTPTSLLPSLHWIPTKEYTGIIIYAADPLPIYGTDRVERIRPALLPELYHYGDSQREIFLLADARRVAPEFLAKWGVVAYTDSVDEYALRERVGSEPLRIMAYGGFGRYPTDIVLTKSDAEQILSSESNRRLVTEGRIAVILSPSVVRQPEQP